MTLTSCPMSSSGSGFAFFLLSSMQSGTPRTISGYSRLVDSGTKVLVLLDISHRHGLVLMPSVGVFR